MASLFDQFDLEVPFIAIRSRSARNEYVINPLNDALSDVLVALWPEFRRQGLRRPPEIISNLPARSYVKIRQSSTGRFRFFGRVMRYRAGEDDLELQFQGFDVGIGLRYVPYLARPGCVLQRALPIAVTCLPTPTAASKWPAAFATLPAHERDAALAADRRLRKDDPGWQSRGTARFACEDRSGSGIVWAVPADLQYADPTIEVLNRSYARAALAESLVFGWGSPGLGGPFPENEIAPSDLLPMPAGDTAPWLFRDREELFAEAAGRAAFLWDGKIWLPHV